MNLMKRAAQIRRKNKRLTVQQSVKKAAAEMRKGKRTTKRATKSVKRVKSVSRGTKRKVSGVAGVGQAMSVLRGVLEQKIGDLEVRKFKATTLRDKRKYAKEIAELKAKHRKLK